MLAISQTLSLELKNFNFAESISTSSACALGAIMAKNIPILNKIECVDLCSKYVVFDIKNLKLRTKNWVFILVKALKIHILLITSQRGRNFTITVSTCFLVVKALNIHIQLVNNALKGWKIYNNRFFNS